MPKGVTITKDDTLRPLLVKTSNGTTVYDFAGLTGKFYMLDSTDTAKVEETASNVTVQPTFTITATASTDRINSAEHTVENGDPIILATSGTLPAGLTASTRYWAINCVPGSFQLAATFNGPPINITDAGTGTHTAYVVGSIKYVWQAGDVDTAGDYRAWFVILNGTARSTYPAGEGLPVSIVTRRFGNQ